MARHKDLQRALHHYRQVTGIKEVNMADVAKFAVEKLGMKLPAPVDPLERLARDLAKAAREETRYSEKTGRPYRANHMYVQQQGAEHLRLWLDIDDGIPRTKMVKCLGLRREQMVGDAYHLALDADHWNEINPGEKPIQMVLDFTDDVAERKATDGHDEDAA